MSDTINLNDVKHIETCSISTSNIKHICLIRLSDLLMADIDYLSNIVSTAIEKILKISNLDFLIDISNLDSQYSDVDKFYDEFFVHTDDVFNIEDDSYSLLMSEHPEFFIDK